jgi:hypothetical protein
MKWFLLSVSALLVSLAAFSHSPVTGDASNTAKATFAVQ